MKHLGYFHKGDWTFEELRESRKMHGCSGRVSRKHIKILIRADKRTERQQLRSEIFEEIN
jgi:hypothetical protein